MNEDLDTDWINEIENIEKDNDIFYMEKINEITLIYLYINNKGIRGRYNSKTSIMRQRNCLTVERRNSI